MLKRCLLGVCVGLVLWAGSVQAAVQTKEVVYRDGEVALKGWLAWDDAIAGPRPGVVVVHEWWGLNDYALGRARMLAGMGYAAFAMDMYGDNKVTTHGGTAGEWMKQITGNIAAWRERARLGLEAFRQEAVVDKERVAAIGYCFGGATVMQMAYAGMDLRGVASFHGSLPPAVGEDLGRIRAKVLVAHGQADGFIPAERIVAFQKGLEEAKADWSMVVYGGAKHGFTNPEAGKMGIEGLAYDESADKRSWKALEVFLKEVFVP
ncbi:MAG: dienelactone hydrolase family protein [Magnetococcales bacterium]|nr:dienelactone hydrolase family protein [Magnetococcales bacterium]